MDFHKFYFENREWVRAADILLPAPSPPLPLSLLTPSSSPLPVFPLFDLPATPWSVCLPPCALKMVLNGTFEGPAQNPICPFILQLPQGSAGCHSQGHCVFVSLISFQDDWKPSEMRLR